MWCADSVNRLSMIDKILCWRLIEVFLSANSDINAVSGFCFIHLYPPHIAPPIARRLASMLKVDSMLIVSLRAARHLQHGYVSGFIKEKARDDSTDYLIRGIAKRHWRNKQSAPTPYRISIPLAGERIRDKHERLLTAYPSSVKFGDFRIKDKAKTLFKNVWSGTSCLTDAKIIKILRFYSNSLETM